MHGKYTAFMDTIALDRSLHRRTNSIAVITGEGVELEELCNIGRVIIIKETLIGTDAYCDDKINQHRYNYMTQ